MKEPKGNRNCRCNINIKPKDLFRAPSRHVEPEPPKAIFTPIWGLKTPEGEREIRQALREKACAIEDLQKMGFETNVKVIDSEKAILHLVVNKPKINFIK